MKQIEKKLCIQCKTKPLGENCRKFCGMKGRPYGAKNKNNK